MLRAATSIALPTLTTAETSSVPARADKVRRMHHRTSRPGATPDVATAIINQPGWRPPDRTVRGGYNGNGG